MPMNEMTQANATAKTAFGWRNGLGATLCGDAAAADETAAVNGTTLHGRAVWRPAPRAPALRRRARPAASVVVAPGARRPRPPAARGTRGDSRDQPG